MLVNKILHQRCYQQRIDVEQKQKFAEKCSRMQKARQYNCSGLYSGETVKLKILSHSLFIVKIIIFIFRLVNEMNDTFEMVFFVAFVFTLLTICGNLLILQLDLVEYKEGALAFCE